MVDTDPPSFGCPGFVSGTKEINQYLQKNVAACISKRLLYRRRYVFYLRRYVFGLITYYTCMYIFHVQILLFVTLKSDQDPDPYLFESLDPDLH